MEVLPAFVAWWLSVAHQNFASVGSNLNLWRASWRQRPLRLRLNVFLQLYFKQQRQIESTRFFSWRQILIDLEHKFHFWPFLFKRKSRSVEFWGKKSPLVSFPKVVIVPLWLNWLDWSKVKSLNEKSIPFINPLQKIHPQNLANILCGFVSTLDHPGSWFCNCWQLWQLGMTQVGHFWNFCEHSQLVLPQTDQLSIFF